MAQAAPVSQELVQRGAYLARAGDCIACHTAREGQPFAGGLPLNTPIGMIYSTNITPDLETGIGRYSMDDFVKVMREGVAKDGHHLYPAMPYTSYARLSQEDLSALYAYFMQGVEPVRNPNRPTQLSWPLGMRSLMAVWNALYFKKGEYAADPDKSASWNRGAYLVQGLGHCGECHTPRGVAGQDESGQRTGRQALSRRRHAGQLVCISPDGGSRNRAACLVERRDSRIPQNRPHCARSGVWRHGGSGRKEQPISDRSGPDGDCRIPEIAAAFQ